MSLKTFLVGAASMLLCCSCVLGQAREVSESEISKRIVGAEDLRRALPFRVTESDYMLRTRDSADQPWSVSTSEYSPPDAWRLILWKGGRPGGSISFETISIGDFIFRRRGNGEWDRTMRAEKTNQLSTSRVGGGESPAAKANGTRTVECSHLGEDVVEGDKAQVFEVKRTSTLKGSNGDVVEIYTTRFWFNPEGLMLKEVIEQENLGTPRVHRVVREYVYDPAIKIQPPLK